MPRQVSSLCVNRLFIILLLAALSPLQLLTPPPFTTETLRPGPLTQIILLLLIQTKICEASTEIFRFRVRGRSLRPALGVSAFPLFQALVVL